MAIDVSLPGALRRRVDLQERLWQSAHATLRRAGKDANAKQLHREIRSYLIRASDQHLLREGQEAIHRDVLFTGPDASGHFDIAVGTVRNFHRIKDLPHFTRSDGGWFDFQLLVKETAEQIEILAYDFELRLPPGAGFDFVRFDLNPPGHDTRTRRTASDHTSTSTPTTTAWPSPPP